jgi:hypothetical protein
MSKIKKFAKEWVETSPLVLFGILLIIWHCIKGMLLIALTISICIPIGVVDAVLLIITLGIYDKNKAIDLYEYFEAKLFPPMFKNTHKNEQRTK